MSTVCDIFHMAIDLSMGFTHDIMLMVDLSTSVVVNVETRPGMSFLRIHGRGMTLAFPGGTPCALRTNRSPGLDYRKSAAENPHGF